MTERRRIYKKDFKQEAVQPVISQDGNVSAKIYLTAGSGSTKQIGIMPAPVMRNSKRLPRKRNRAGAGQVKSFSR